MPARDSMEGRSWLLAASSVAAGALLVRVGLTSLGLLTALLAVGAACAAARRAPATEERVAPRRQRPTTRFVFLVVSTASAWATVWASGATADEFGVRDKRETAIVTAVLACSALAGFVTRTWTTVSMTVALALVALAIWEVIVQLSDGRVLWDPRTYGSPIFLVVALPAFALAAAAGVGCGQVVDRVRALR